VKLDALSVLERARNSVGKPSNPPAFAKSVGGCQTGAMKSVNELPLRAKDAIASGRDCQADISAMWKLASVVESDIPAFRVGQQVQIFPCSIA